MSFQLRRGDDAIRQTIVFDEGELVYVTDTKKLYVGDGVTSGGVDILASEHNHDDRYYQKGEVDTLIQNLGDSQELLLENHTTDLTVHRKINDLGNLPTELFSAQRILSIAAGKSNTGHDHNSVYYTKTESNSQNQSLQDSIDLGEVKVSDTDPTKGTLDEKIGDGQGIVVYPDVSDPTGQVLRIGAQVYMATVSGQLKPCYVDSSKGGKVLSVEAMNFLWAESSVQNGEWMQIGHATDADSSYIAPYDMTIVGVSAHCENANGNTKPFRLYVNSTEVNSNLFTLSGNANVAANDQTINIDVNAGDRIRLRAGGGGTIQDTVISLFTKGRAT